MALPSSGQISFNDVRTETSQSTFTSYTFSRWASGTNSGCLGIGSNADYAPINLISSGSGSGTNALRYSPNMTMSAPLRLSDWYLYDHIIGINTEATASLYSHFDGVLNFQCNGFTSMVPVDVGTSATTLSLNISGSPITGSSADTGCWMIFYGKPWTQTGVSDTTMTGCGYVYSSATAILIDSGSIRDNVNKTISYNYNYDINKGNYIYYVVVREINDCFCVDGGC